jgi:hypothetical protein
MVYSFGQRFAMSNDDYSRLETRVSNCSEAVNINRAPYLEASTTRCNAAFFASAVPAPAHSWRAQWRRGG